MRKVQVLDTATDPLVRQPGGPGCVLIVICVVVGLFTGIPEATVPGAAGPSVATYPGWLFLFVPIAFGFGFIVIPLLAAAMERRSSLEWSKYLWIMSGLAPLALLVAAFASSLLAGSANWGYLINAACPLGVSLAFAFRVSDLEGDTNVL